MRGAASSKKEPPKAAHNFIAGRMKLVIADISRPVIWAVCDMSEAYRVKLAIAVSRYGKSMAVDR